MDLTWTQQWLVWAEANPLLLVGTVSCLLFVEGFAVIGLFVPGLMMVFMLGALVGLGRMDFWLAYVAACSGAIAGDAFNYWLGYRYRERLAQHWPLSRYPKMHQRGQEFFHQYGMLSIPLGRYIGPLRSFVPVIAGTLGMRPQRFVPMVILTGLMWVPSFMLPGMLFGLSLDLAAAYATRLSLLLGAVVGIIWLLSWLVRATYAASSRTTPWLLKRMVNWLRKHPYVGHWFSPLFNPGRGEMLSIAMLGLVLMTTLSLFIAAVMTLVIGDSGTSLDLRVAAMLLDWRNAVTDPLWISLATISDWPVLLPVIILMAIWLLWRKQPLASLHWLLAVVLAPLLALALQFCLRLVPVWPVHLQAIGAFPDVGVTLLIATAGALPMLLVRELPAQRRKWFYLATGVVVSLFLLARMALGLSYLSALWSGSIIAVLWVSLIGIGYRVRVKRGWPVFKHIAFFGLVFVLVSGLYTYYNWPSNQKDWQPKLIGDQLTMQAWWQTGWSELPSHRSRLTQHNREQFNLQYVGDPKRLITQLQATGWHLYASQGGDWWQVLSPKPEAEKLPLFRLDYQGYTSPHMLTRQTPEGMSVLRLWRSGWTIGNDQQLQPLWLSILTTEQIAQRGYWFNVWQQKGSAQNALHDLQVGGEELEWQQVRENMLLIRER